MHMYLQYNCRRKTLPIVVMSVAYFHDNSRRLYQCRLTGPAVILSIQVMQFITQSTLLIHCMHHTVFEHALLPR